MDLKTTYMGLELRNPLVPAASPLSEDVDRIRQMEDAGASAVVLHSLFEEQILHDSQELSHHLQRGVEHFAEAITYFPDLDTDYLGPEEYLEHIRACKEAVDIPIFASLNGTTPGGWTEYAAQMEEAGADGIELNVYYVAAEEGLTGQDIERRYVDILKEVKGQVSVPVAMKLGPHFSALMDFTSRLEEAGADGLVLFNRFYQPNIDLEELEVKPDLVLSNSAESRLPLRWIAILHGHVGMSMAATTGIHTHLDVLRMLLAGADVTMMASALLMNGVRHLSNVLYDLQNWMVEKEYISIEQMKGSMSQQSVADPAAFERANYMKTLHSWQ
ncbi:MAG: dihydroorotate dehydrogenase-like protein [bacterium]